MANSLVVRAREDVLAAVEAAKSDVRLASPFMGAGVLHALADAKKSGQGDWRVMTRLDAASIAHGSLSPQGLRALLRVGVAVRSLPYLHAKVFVVDATFGLVGSANLTEAGLGSTASRSNAELGVILNVDQREEASRQFDAWWEAAVPVTEALLVEAEEKARSLPSGVSRVLPDPETSLRQERFLEQADSLLAEAGRVGLWIKAVYQGEDAANLGWGENSWFSSSRRGRPSFAPGDLVLMYAKGAQVCNAIVEVSDMAQLDPDRIVGDGRSQEEADRWPWVNDVVERLHVPASKGVPLHHLGFTGQSLQGGHKRLGINEFAAAINYLASGGSSSLH